MSKTPVVLRHGMLFMMAVALLVTQGISACSQQNHIIHVHRKRTRADIVLSNFFKTRRRLPSDSTQFQETGVVKTYPIERGRPVFGLGDQDKIESNSPSVAPSTPAGDTDATESKKGTSANKSSTDEKTVVTETKEQEITFSQCFYLSILPSKISLSKISVQLSLIIAGVVELKEDDPTMGMVLLTLGVTFIMLPITNKLANVRGMNPLLRFVCLGAVSGLLIGSSFEITNGIKDIRVLGEDGKNLMINQDAAYEHFSCGVGMGLAAFFIVLLLFVRWGNLWKFMLSLKYKLPRKSFLKN